MATLRSIWEEDILIEIMGMIVKKVISISDYVRMSAVCKSWRSMLAIISHHMISKRLGFCTQRLRDTRISDEINHVVVLKPGCCEVKMKLINIVKYNTAHHIRPCDSELHYITDSGLKYVYLAKSITGELLIIWNKTDRLSEHDDAHDDEHDDEEHDDDYDLGIYHTSKLMIERYEGFYKTGKDFESITSLGDQTLFVSPNSNSFSVPARSGNGCQANSIYFTVDALHTLYVKSLTRYRQSGIYCIQEGRIKRPFPNPPLWFQPRLRN
ncbi:hypothetical protein RND71_002978 [Anisodus tanguticus]|uniref:KIB1-4 beta-propeller domain-containing protein n=1 Tax=Anisodus tanguticus TaxID=243964 RepID=A0AAE1SX27_9SOLA|nr:hypothetical protein RND71_002978 [Anisodus tanguticus]